jgi:hypothetical protein
VQANRAGETARQVAVLLPPEDTTATSTPPDTARRAPGEETTERKGI